MNGKHKVIIESEVEERIPSSILDLLTQAAKVCHVDIWVTLPDDEDLDEHGYGPGV